jgi:hypothetical protein
VSVRARALRLWTLSITMWACGWGVGVAQINMPDAALIHGRALPAPELPNGTVTVRVVREAIGNNITGQDVRVTAGGAIQTATTDDQGRAEFTGLSLGANAQAEAVVDGEALESEPFTVPVSGGLRVILVAGIEEAAARARAEAAAAAAAPPVDGVVVFGPNTRVFIEFQDDTLQVFYILEILNNARARVDIGGPLLLDLPTGAGGAAVLQGSSPTATVSGDRLTVTGPFAAGVTSVQVGFQLRQDSSEFTLQQTWPVPLEQLSVGVQRLGDLSVSSPQFSTVGEVNAESGTPFFLANGPAMAAGSTLTMQLSNLPAHNGTPRIVALSLAAGIIALGVWWAIGAPAPVREPRSRLIERRDALLGELAPLEKQQRTGGPLPGAEEAERQRLIADLEEVYGELEAVRVRPRGGGGDVAA